MSNKPILYWIPEMDGSDLSQNNQHTHMNFELPGTVTKCLIVSLVLAGIALMLHIVVTDTSYWRYVQEKNGTVVQRDGLWKSCVKIQDVQTQYLECEDVSILTVKVVFKIIQAADLITFVFMTVALVANILAFYKAWTEKYQVGVVKTCIAGHLLAALALMILWIGFVVDTTETSKVNLGDDKKYTLQWCYYLAIVTFVLELIAAFLVAFHLRTIREWSLENDIDLIQQSIVGQQPVQGLIQMPQKPLPLIGFQQFLPPEPSPGQSTSLGQPKDQNITEVQPMQLIPVVQPKEQNIPVVQPMQLIPMVQPKEQHFTVVKPMQSIPVVQPKDQSLSVVQPIQPMPVVQPIQPMPVVQPIQSMPVVQPIQAMPVVQQIQPMSVVQPIQPIPVVQSLEPIPVIQPIKPIPVVQQPHPGPLYLY
ncbi:hypothetical protein LOTGIDRAFT_237457 [Lottia gigantea]|uniref:Uncharacterized protein n=1 Tax=Lottia gigantea TaxID=225164 RepID=V4AJB7_LOTGI|nr:hypothetical protein LOTGIDRAFT_237457 [Lottia gigantea]ESP04274.1 hypothetical protein LOTGIDRAFT_237457 [Lottia gigantea]